MYALCQLMDRHEDSVLVIIIFNYFIVDAMNLTSTYEQIVVLFVDTSHNQGCTITTLYYNMKYHKQQIKK